MWERFIEICNIHNSLFGIKWSYLRSLLDGVELKKTYTLNPLAPEFIPRQFQPETYIRLPSINSIAYNGMAPNMRFVSPYMPPAPIYQVPTTYFPPPPSFFPIRPSVFPQSSAPQLNPWGIGYPQMISPNNATWMKKKQEVSPPIRREDVRPPPGLIPPHQCQVRPATTSPHQVMDSYLGHVRPSLNGQPIPATVHTKPLQRRLFPVQNGFDKDQIQFLHNVHFPERQVRPLSNVFVIH